MRIHVAREPEMLPVFRREKDRLTGGDMNLPAVQLQVQQPAVDDDELIILLHAGPANTPWRVDHIPEDHFSPAKMEIHPGYVFETYRHGVLPLFHYLAAMTTPISLSPNRLVPDDLAVQLGPFGSWPKDGSLPNGYFTRPVTDEAATFYKENGFLVLHDALSAAEVEELKQDTLKVCRNEDGRIGGIETADPSMSDLDAMKRVLCIHFPHKLTDVFYRALAYPALTDVLTKVISPNVKCMQSMLFVKASGKPGQAWHQDEDYIPTRDRSLAGAWIALDDATVENGCLWVLPGSHARGILWPQKFHFDKRFDCARESYNFPWKDEDSVPVEVKAGSIVFFNGYLLHRSLPNRATTGFRRALVNHYMSAESFLPWIKDDKSNMAMTDFRDIVMVAGEDPFAYKGVIDHSKAHVRADGQGGCADWDNENQKRLAAEHAKKTAAQKEAAAA